MSQDVWPKVGASFGILAALLLILTAIFGPTEEPPGFEESATQFQTYLQENRGEIQASVALQFGAIVAFAWFLGSIFYRVRPAEPAARLSVVAVAGGILVIIGGLIGSSASGASVYHLDTLSADAVLALWDMSLFGYLFFLTGFGVLAGATAVLGLRLAALPAAMTAYSALAALVALVVGVVGTFSETGAFSPSDGVLGYIAFLLFIVWLLAMGATLVREPRPVVAATTRPTAEPPPP